MLSNLRHKIYTLLRKSEKWTKTDMVYLAKGGSWLSINQILFALSAFILSITIGYLLPQTTYGIYKYVLSLAAILSVVSLSGMNTAVTKAVSQGYEGSLKNSFKVQLKWGILFFVLSLMFSAYYFYRGNSTLGISLLIVGIFSPFINSANTYSAFLLGKKNFKYITKFGSILIIFNFSALFITLLVTQNVLIIIFVYFASAALSTLYLYYKTIKTFHPNDKNLPDTISYGKHLSFINSIAIIAQYIDGVFVFNLLGSAQLAVFSFALAMPEQIKSFIKNGLTIYFPKLSQKTAVEIKTTIFGKLFKAALALLAVTAIYYFFAPLAFKLFFPKYLDSIKYSQIYSLSLISVLAYVPLYIFQAQSAKKELYILNTIRPAIQLILSFTLIYFYDIWGAIFARIIISYFALFLGLFLLKKLK